MVLPEGVAEPVLLPLGVTEVLCVPLPVPEPELEGDTEGLAPLLRVAEGLLLWEGARV